MSPNGGPAFPQPWHPDMGWAPRESPAGMSLRDWFAGQALAGMLAKDDNLTYEQAAQFAYCQADAMIAARELEEGA